MDSQEVGDLLEECVNTAAAAHQQSSQSTEAARQNYHSCKGSLCAELASLLQEAMDMKWPFVPEKWQYKLSVSAKDKTNLNDLISKHLPQLLAVLKASIMAQEARTAQAVVFLVDRFLYWTDESSRLLKITKLLHRCHPDTPVAPQLVIRQARVYLNSGKLQKAEYILSRLINSSGATGCWLYHSESDRALVQAVSVQVRGMILQKLGLWLQAAELIWASLVGYYSLLQPDKKGISTSLGILANILVSMNDEDFRAFRTNQNIDLQSLLGTVSHRLLSAAQAAKMAVVYSQYTSLYVLTNVATQGTCLLSYSFSTECLDSQRESFLQQAREAFAIGLLTKGEGEQVTSQQELHTFLKAAFSLTVTHKWLGTPQEVVVQATQACQKALANFYDYCHADKQDKDSLCTAIIRSVTRVKHLLQVEPFINSDMASFIPDSYRDIKDTSVNFTLASFSKVMQRFQKFHASLCKTTDRNCKSNKDEMDGARLCITALGTTLGTLNTECGTEALKVSKATPEGDDSSAVHPQQNPNQCPTLGSTDDLGSSWQNFSLSSSGFSWPSSSGYTGSGVLGGGANTRDQNNLTTEVDEEKADSMFQFPDKNKKRDLNGYSSSVNSSQFPRFTASATSSSNVSSDSERFEVMQAGVETLDTDDWMLTGAGLAQKPTSVEGEPQSLSELTLRTSSSSLNNSLSSQSSWEKMSTDMNSPTNGKPQPTGLSKAGTSQSSKSQESDGSFCLLETLDSETSDVARGPTFKDHTSGGEYGASSKPQNPNIDTADSVTPAAKSSSATPHPNMSQCASTETSTDISFEMVEVNEVSSTEKGDSTQVKNPWCYSCLMHSTNGGNTPKRQYLLSHKDYRALLAGVCHECLLKRLHSDAVQFKLKEDKTSYSALQLKFSKANGLWTARETCVYIGEPMGMQGKQRTAIWVQFLHQEERLSSYVGKDYLKPKQIQFHLRDVERQMTAQYYVTEFNKRLYDKDAMAQIFFIPSEALLILNENEIVGCVTVEPYMLGDFVKLTNNKEKKDKRFHATEYGLAFGHFTYLFSDRQEVVVDLQGWVTANGKGLTYLTDPQIHSTKVPQGPSNFSARGLRYFLEEQHGPECNGICELLNLPPVVGGSHVLP
ncbi:alpha-protein kinase 1 isoform X1 [Solea senegalensis]|uniref:Alpha-protein kinase 1 isoform X1 n=1 Tax=Solea senegalensis TaxID=28829 RepID=A0AAV6QXR2_SOLSE|nr:alpha-protein kinase 1 [Solea senegalensis]XP_043877054.1 alpha-protein kinase 1 [Solea senegalensis]XP_043877055.1 alpha-protein kinase 1 [Solea senegalensis]XP_043877056.1 alpha-protein kinase 1 [Solea senegalensis]KAG7497903.1 alpha-protein kinase 1 isoform X1 [Solea senegalensis]